MKTKLNSSILMYLCFVLIFPISNSLLKLTETSSGGKAFIEKKNIIKQTDTNKVASIDKIKIPKDKYEKVEIKRSTNFVAKTPTYVKTDDNYRMKSPILIQTNENQISNPGMTERPNYLSTVIRSSPTSVTSSGVRIDADSPTFDLETISEHFILIL
jgi:hypothetical protein